MQLCYSHNPALMKQGMLMDSCPSCTHGRDPSAPMLRALLRLCLSRVGMALCRDSC